MTPKERERKKERKVAEDRAGMSAMRRLDIPVLAVKPCGPVPGGTPGGVDKESRCLLDTDQGGCREEEGAGGFIRAFRICL